MARVFYLKYPSFVFLAALAPFEHVHRWVPLTHTLSLILIVLAELDYEDQSYD